MSYEESLCAGHGPRLRGSYSPQRTRNMKRLSENRRVATTGMKPGTAPNLHCFYPFPS